MEALLRQVKQQLDSWKEWGDSKRIVLAVSGGVDSMVLLHVMSEIVNLQDYQSKELIVAHYNHQLRSEETHRAESELVKAAAAQRELLYFGGIWENPTENNIEANAREARYQFFADVLRGSDADTLMTAHHLNDTVETFLMRVMRGTSMKGSQGIPSNYRRILVDHARHAVVTQVMRPLIAVPKTDLYQYAAKYQVPYLEDISNDNHKFLRNRMRHQIIPLFEKENPQFLKNVLSLQKQFQASYLTHYQDYLALEPQLLMYTKELDWILYIPAFLELSEAKRLTYLTIFFEERLVDQLQQYSKEVIEQVASMMRKDSEPNSQLMLGGNWQAVRQYDYLYIKKPLNAAVKESSANPLMWLKENRWFELNADEKIGWFERDAVTPLMLEDATASLMVDFSQGETGLYVRHRQAGDVMTLANARQETFHKKVARLMIDEKIPLAQREMMWLLCDQDNRILWLVDHKRSQLYRPLQSDKITHIILYQKNK